MQNIRIVFIDSGISEDQKITDSYTILDDNNSYSVIKDSCEDKIGHGTAIAGLLLDELSLQNIEIISIKIYDRELEIDEGKLLFSLKFVLEYIPCNILHISSGITYAEQYSYMYNLCQQIYARGTIIVSAFDNNGAISYPAAFPFVIGVDMGENHGLKKTEYDFVESDVINIRTSCCSQRVRWTMPSTIISWGSSFTSVYITTKIAKILLQFPQSSFSDILSKLRDDAKHIYQSHPVIGETEKVLSKIKKAIVFPFNKEMHALARYESFICCEIIHFCDTKYSAIIGKSISDLLNIHSNHTIKNIEQINWMDDFDTIILGHCDELNALSKTDWIEKIVHWAYTYKKSIYSFESIDSYLLPYDYLVYEYPAVKTSMVPQNRFGKMRMVNKPILAVFGTSSKQGKYTLQLFLRQALKNMGYKVGQLSTEPSGRLFGMEKVYPMGYHSSMDLSADAAVALLNEYLWEISVGIPEPDIILVGGQSGTVPYDYNNISQFPLLQLEFLIGVHPDCSILCFNPHDPTEYIQRTIKAIESLSDNPVCALVMFPQKTIDFAMSIKYRRMDINSDEALSIKRKISSATGKPVYLLNEEVDMLSLVNDIINYFSE